MLEPHEHSHHFATVSTQYEFLLPDSLGICSNCMVFLDDLENVFDEVVLRKLLGVGLWPVAIYSHTICFHPHHHIGIWSCELLAML